MPGSGDARDFSLIPGGPLYQLLLKTRLAQAPLGLVRRRMLLFAGLAWLPLLILSLIDGRALDGVDLPFLADVGAYARFLVALPMLMLAELTVHGVMQPIISNFRERGLISGASVPQFNAAIDAALRLRNSVPAEIVILVLVYALGPWLWTHGLAVHTDTWYATVVGDQAKATPAGWWFVLVSAPIFQFLLLRWYFRLAIWWRLLWHISRSPPELNALHPDRAGGIGFLGGSMYAFLPILFAQSVVVSGIVFTRVLNGSHVLTDFVGEIAVLAVLLVAQIIAPLLFFTPLLIDARTAAMAKLGRLAMTYARAFGHKWLGPELPAAEPLLGSADIQSLADLASSYDIVRGMRPVPFGLPLLLYTVMTVVLPFAPLVLMAVPFTELVTGVVNMLF